MNRLKGDAKAVAMFLHTLADQMEEHGGYVQLKFAVSYPACDGTCTPVKDAPDVEA